MASIRAADVLEHSTMPSKLRPHLEVVALVVQDGKKKKLHLIQAEPRVCQDIDEAMGRMAGAVNAERGASAPGEGQDLLGSDPLAKPAALQGLEDIDDRFDDGAAPLMRKQSLNLRGKADSNIKRRSWSYGTVCNASATR